MDEATNATGRYVGNFVVGATLKMNVGKPHLLATRLLERTNSQTIARTVIEAEG